MNELKMENIRTFRVGSIYRIHPSMGFAGIEEGVIKIIKIVGKDEHDQDKDNTKISFLDECENDEEKVPYEDCNWIGYEHRDNNGFATKGSFYMMPDWLFAEHVSCY